MRLITLSGMQSYVSHESIPYWNLWPQTVNAGSSIQVVSVASSSVQWEQVQDNNAVCPETGLRVEHVAFTSASVKTHEELLSCTISTHDILVCGCVKMPIHMHVNRKRLVVLRLFSWINTSKHMHV